MWKGVKLKSKQLEFQFIPLLPHSESFHWARVYIEPLKITCNAPSAPVTFISFRIRTKMKIQKK